MKIVRENINFERGENPRSVMGLGAGVDVTELLKAVVDSKPGERAVDYWVDEETDIFWMYKTWLTGNGPEQAFCNLGVNSNTGEYTLELGYRKAAMSQNTYRESGVFDSIRKGDINGGVKEINEYIEKIMNW